MPALMIDKPTTESGQWNFRVAVAVCLLMAAHMAHAEVLELEGTVKNIDPDARAISIVRKTPKGEKILDLEVAKNAGDLGSLKEGDAVAFAYNPDVDIISKIEKGLSEDDVLALTSLQGEWLAFAEESGGKRMKKDELKSKRKTLIVKGDRFTLSTNYYRCTGRIMPDTKDGPNAFNLSGRFQGGEQINGKLAIKNESDIVMKAIAEVSDDTLRMCYSVSRDGTVRERPTEYETEEGKDGVSVSFKKTVDVTP